MGRLVEVELLEEVLAQRIERLEDGVARKLRFLGGMFVRLRGSIDCSARRMSWSGA